MIHSKFQEPTFKIDLFYLFCCICMMKTYELAYSATCIYQRDVLIPCTEILITVHGVFVYSQVRVKSVFFLIFLLQNAATWNKVQRTVF